MSVSTSPSPSSSEASRTFSKWVNNPVVEDYALRYAPRQFRTWSMYAVLMSAIGGIAFMADFAIGASTTVSYGFSSAAWGIVAAAVIIFVTGIPIAYYSARYNVDMDLLTRGSGFGYLGSTLTSLIYATFTIIYFSTEGSILAQAFKLFFGIPLPIGYLIGGIGIIPLVAFGMTALSKFQVWTQPLWMLLIIIPLLAMVIKDPDSLNRWVHFGGTAANGSHFSLLGFGLSMGVVLSLITQIGEQVDYLRFMPDRTPKAGKKWMLVVILGGPGWVLIGCLKQLAGSYLGSTIFSAVGPSGAIEPIQMFVSSFDKIIPWAGLALAVATLLVVLSQLKIQVTNAYSGSLSWSNFFSRLLHSHPGRVVWLFLQVAIALVIMEIGMFRILNFILGFYSNLAVAWIAAVTSDLVVNKRILKISPPYIEFKRAHLYNFNPVGFGAMLISAAISVIAFFGVFGSFLQAFSPLLALVISFVLVPVIALATKGKYYIAREDPFATEQAKRKYEDEGPKPLTECGHCNYSYEREDVTYCPFIGKPICSLCCSLEKSCHDMCKVGSQGGRTLPYKPVEATSEIA